MKVSKETDNIKELRKRINDELEIEINKINKTTKFKILSQLEQNKLLRSKNSRQYKSYELLERSGLTISGIDRMWGIYSNYSHTEYISDRQSNSYRKSPSELRSKCSTLIWLNKNLTVRLISMLTDTFPKINQYYRSLPQEKQMIIYDWQKIFGK